MKFWYITAKENEDYNFDLLPPLDREECPRLFAMMLQVVRQVDNFYCRDYVLTGKTLEFVDYYPRMPIMPNVYKFEKYMRFFHEGFFFTSARKSKIEKTYDSLPEYMQDCLTIKYQDL